MKLSDYKFNEDRLNPNWPNAHTSHGSVRIYGHHHICALMTLACGFSAQYYAERLARRKSFYDAAGVKRSLPSVTKEELMMIDMDQILSAVWDAEKKDGWVVEMFTNDREDPTWIKFVADQPDAYLVSEYPSRMGPYNIQQWLFSRKDPRRLWKHSEKAQPVEAVSA